MSSPHTYTSTQTRTHTATRAATPTSARTSAHATARPRKRTRRRTLLDTPPRQPLGFKSAPRNPIPHQEIRPIDTPRVTLGSQRVGQGSMPLSRVPLQAIAGQTVAPQPLQRVSFAKQQVSLPPLDQPAQPRSTFAPLGIASPASAIASTADHAIKSTADHAANSPKPLSLQHMPLPASRLAPLDAPAIATSFTTSATTAPAITTGATAMCTDITSTITASAPETRVRAGQREISPLLPVGHDSDFARRLWPTPAQRRAREQRKLTPEPPLSAPHATTADPHLAEARLPLQGQQVELHPIPAVQQPIRTRTTRVTTYANSATTCTNTAASHTSSVADRTTSATTTLA